MNSKALRFLGSPLALAAFAAGLAGCESSGLAASYHPLVPAPAVPAKSPREPQFILTAHMKTEIKVMLARGYTLVGYSTFAAADHSSLADQRAAAEKQAKAVGADLVLLKTKSGDDQVDDASVPYLIEQSAAALPEGADDGVGVDVDQMGSGAVYLRQASHRPRSEPPAPN